MDYIITWQGPRASIDYLSPCRIGLQGRVGSPGCFVLQASLGRFPQDMGAGWDSGCPEDSSSQQDSPLASLFLALKSLRNRTCGTQLVLGIRLSRAEVLPGGSFLDTEDLGRHKTSMGHLKTEDIDTR